VLELGEAEYMVRANGYLTEPRRLPGRAAPHGGGGVPISLGDVATIQVGPEMRRGIAELNGEGEVAGGVVILRSGANARATIAAVTEKLETLKAGLPPGVEVVTTYDRSQLIDRAIDNLSGKLIEEFMVVALVCGLFLWHARSALVAILTLPLGVLAAFLIMNLQGVNANIMSLGGIAIAIGAMVDAAVVMIENAHKHIERWAHDHPDEKLAGEERWKVITEAAVEVGPALFLQPADHHPVVHPGVQPAGPGGPAVRAPGLYQELRHGGGGDPVHHPRAGSDGLSDPRTDPGRTEQSDQPLADGASIAGRWTGCCIIPERPWWRLADLRHHGLAS
jgi:Cu/Ag efflux pump CusA